MFPIMSEKYITYRPLKHQKGLKQLRGVWNKPSVDARMQKMQIRS